jgi:hypothetical protein
MTLVLRTFMQILLALSLYLFAKICFDGWQIGLWQWLFSPSNF